MHKHGMIVDFVHQTLHLPGQNDMCNGNMRLEKNESIKSKKEEEDKMVVENEVGNSLSEEPIKSKWWRPHSPLARPLTSANQREMLLYLPDHVCGPKDA